MDLTVFLKSFQEYALPEGMIAASGEVDKVRGEIFTRPIVRRVTAPMVEEPTWLNSVARSVLRWATNNSWRSPIMIF